MAAFTISSSEVISALLAKHNDVNWGSSLDALLLIRGDVTEDLSGLQGRLRRAAWNGWAVASATMARWPSLGPSAASATATTSGQQCSTRRSRLSTSPATTSQNEGRSVLRGRSRRVGKTTTPRSQTEGSRDSVSPVSELRQTPRGYVCAVNLGREVVYRGRA